MAWSDAARAAALAARRHHAVTGEKFKIIAHRSQPAKGGAYAYKLKNMSHKSGPMVVQASLHDFKSRDDAIRAGIKALQNRRKK